MATWSGIRKKLETEYLAQSLQGHIQYYATSYSRSHDHEGRAAIRYDGKEIIKKSSRDAIGTIGRKQACFPKTKNTRNA